MNDLYMQYGCGLSAPPGWLNFDASPSLRLMRIPVVGPLYARNAPPFPSAVRFGDIVRGLPVAPESCSGIYCSHVLEHLAFEDAQQALHNTFRYLRKGGTFRLVVPDLQQLARAYVGSESSAAAHHFMESAGLGRKEQARGLAGFLRGWLSHSAHLWMWDEKSMVEKLRETGFTAIRRCQFNDAEDSKFREVEEQDRFVNCLAIHCSR